MAQFQQQPALHHLLIIRELQRIADGTNDRLIMLLPPGSAKSTYGSMIFPSYLLSIGVGLDIIGAAYNSEHAAFLSGKAIGFARDMEDVLPYSLVKQSERYWTTSNRGQYRAAGIDSGISGRRADVLIIDDPHKSREDAENIKERERVWNWYRGDALPRTKPGSRVVIIMTHWHVDDLAGRLIASQPGRWKVLKVPAVAEDAETDPLGRAVGEGLWPEYWTGDYLAQREIDVGPREWAALYQQRPVPLTGGFFDIDAIGRVSAMPEGAALVRAWDLAATPAVMGADPDWTAGPLLGRTRDHGFVLGDMVRLRGDSAQVERAIRATAERDGRRVTIFLAQDPGAAGKAYVTYLVKKLAGYKVIVRPVSGSKITRATPFSSQVAAGNLSIVKDTPWTVALLDEMALFPFGHHDDQVDALADAFNTLTEKKYQMVITDEMLSHFATRPPPRAAR